jgi:TonB family protein
MLSQLCWARLDVDHDIGFVRQSAPGESSGGQMFRKQGWLWSGALALLGLTCTDALARDWPETAGWTIVEGETYCGMSLEYEGKGETELTVGKFLDGSALLLITNDAWSAKKDQLYDLEFFVGDEVFSGGQSRGVGESYGRKGFATKFESSFFKAFAAGSGLKIYMGETLVDSLQLKGSAAAMVTVDRCLASVRGVNDAAERERRRFAHITDDPFAKSTAATHSSSAAQGPERSWVSTDDYPASALRSGEEGTTSVTYTVNASGRVENCRVTSSSGSAALDQATCQVVTRRGRYSPPEDGKPYDRTFAQIWRLPSD